MPIPTNHQQHPAPPCLSTTPTTILSEPCSHSFPKNSWLAIGLAVRRVAGRVTISATPSSIGTAAFANTCDVLVVSWNRLEDGKPVWGLQGLEQNPDPYERTTTPHAAMLSHDANDNPIIAMPPTNAWSWCEWACCQCGQSQSIAIYKICTRCCHRKCPGCIPY